MRQGGAGRRKRRDPQLRQPRRFSGGLLASPALRVGFRERGTGVVVIVFPVVVVIFYCNVLEVLLGGLFCSPANLTFRSLRQLALFCLPASSTFLPACSCWPASWLFCVMLLRTRHACHGRLRKKSRLLISSPHESRTRREACRCCPVLTSTFCYICRAPKKLHSLAYHPEACKRRFYTLSSSYVTGFTIVCTCGKQREQLRVNRVFISFLPKESVCVKHVLVESTLCVCIMLHSYVDVHFIV